MKYMYESIPDFKKYVDQYAKHYTEGRSITPEEALQHAIVKEVGKAYEEAAKESEEVRSNERKII